MRRATPANFSAGSRALLGFFSLYLGLAGLMFDAETSPPAAFQMLGWKIEHFLISTTMLIVGLFAVLSWDSTFPDRRDVLVLAPLPIRTRTFFLAKIAAVGSGLGLAIGVFNAGPGLTCPMALSSPNPSLLDMLLPFAHRTFIAYWITMVAAGTFLFCCVLEHSGFSRSSAPPYLPPPLLISAVRRFLRIHEHLFPRTLPKHAGSHG